MEWKSISPDEAKNLKYASRTSRENPFTAIFDAVEKGPVRIDTPENGNLQALKWRLGRAIKKAGLAIVIATLADKTGVVLTKEVKEAAQPPRK